MSDITKIDLVATQDTIDELASKLPKPVGYCILGIKPKIETKTEGGIIKPDAFIHKEEMGAVAVMVLELGDMAYTDKTRFPTGAWCKEGDFVLLGAYRGHRFAVDGQEFIIFNDDMVLGTVEDPRGLGRAY
jgi:co-chaperonin GroES (HSP10)